MKLLTCAEIAEKIGVNVKQLANYINFSTDIQPDKYDRQGNRVPLYGERKADIIKRGYLRVLEKKRKVRRFVVEG